MHLHLQSRGTFSFTYYAEIIVAILGLLSEYTFPFAFVSQIQEFAVHTCQAHTKLNWNKKDYSQVDTNAYGLWFKYADKGIYR